MIPASRNRLPTFTSVRGGSRRRWRSPSTSATSAQISRPALTFYAIAAVFPAFIVLAALVGLIGESQRTADALLGLIEDLGQRDVADQLRGPITALAQSQRAGRRARRRHLGSALERVGLRRGVRTGDEPHLRGRRGPARVEAASPQHPRQPGRHRRRRDPAPQCHIDRTICGADQSASRTTAPDAVRLEFRQVAADAGRGGDDRCGVVLRNSERPAATLPMDERRCVAGDRALGRRLARIRRSTPAGSATTTAPTARWAERSCSSSGSGSPTRHCCSEPSSTQSSSALASWRRGSPPRRCCSCLPATPRSRTRPRRQLADDVAEGRALRLMSHPERGDPSPGDTPTGASRRCCW